MMDPATELRLRGAAADAIDIGHDLEMRFSRPGAASRPPAAGVIGWERYAWRNPKRRCVKCSRKVTSGVVRVGMAGRETDPRFAVLCSTCYTDVMESETPEGWGE